MKLNWTYADKFIVSVLGSVSTYLATPNMTWREGVILGITSILVWLVPNTSNPVTVNPIATNPTQPLPNVGLMPDERQELEYLRSQKAK
jgi:hypothetical protein